MRTGACTVQQSLTAEAASILRHSLSLARRRGHSQVTPLHVAATLLSTTAATTNLLRRACLTSHPHHPPSHPLHCRALELCFNVALNRLPTNPPPPPHSSLIQPLPCLSNALIAALKRAQAHQRRGCIEQQNHQQQQPLLAIKVELEQLIISILDDPSVSRVMREAGFSSTNVKNNIEEDSSSSSCSLSPPSSSFMTHFLKPLSDPNPAPHSHPNEDLRVLLEVMLRRQGRSNSVVVGDSASGTEGLLCELKRRVERGEVPDGLKAAQFISLHLSYVHLRLMSRGDVEMKVSDLRAKIASSAASRVGVIIHAGDLRWAVDDEAKVGLGAAFSPVDHMISEIGRLISELRSSSSRVWFVATASYQTYRSCMMRQPSLEIQWALQAVVVPSIGLALSLQAPSGMDSRTTKLNQFHFQMLEPKPIRHTDEEIKLICCSECISNYQKEALVFRSEATEGPSHLSSWLQHHKDTMSELKRKWNRLCQRLHPAGHNQLHYPPFNQSHISKSHLYGSSHPWWSTSLHYNQSNAIMGTTSISFREASVKPKVGSPKHDREVPLRWLSEVNLHSIERSPNQEVKTTLALGSSLFSDSAIMKDQEGGFLSSRQKLSQQLQENIPWQPKIVPLIMESLHNYRFSENGTWLLIQGTDFVGKRRIARVTAESFSGSADRLIHINASKLNGKTSSETLADAMIKDPKCVVLIEDIDRAHSDFARSLEEGLRKGYLKDQSMKEVSLDHGVFILITSAPADKDEKLNSVVNMRLWVEETSELSCAIGCKKKTEWDSFTGELKKPRREHELDLNICADDDCNGEVEDAVPSDLSQEADSGDLHYRLELLNKITARFTLDASPDQSSQLSGSILSKLQQAFDETRGGTDESERLCVDPAMLEGLMAAAGSFLESQFEKWLKEVFQRCLQTVRKGGKVRLSVQGNEGNGSDSGFMGSLLPNRIHVD